MSSGKTNSIVCKLKKNGNIYEILCKPGTINLYRQNKLGIDNTIISDEIFSNSSKFNKVTQASLKKDFGTDNKLECIKIILKDGVFPLTKEEITTLNDAKRKEIINYLHKYYLDPRVVPAIPHPESRLDTVLDQMKIKVDYNISLERQLRDILKFLPEFIPIKPVNPPLDRN
jgi:ribosome maturation protein SDO1